MMVWMGVYSQSFLPPVSKVTARVLEQTTINVPVRAQVAPAVLPPVRAQIRKTPVDRPIPDGSPALPHPLPPGNHPDHHGHLDDGPGPHPAAALFLRLRPPEPGGSHRRTGRLGICLH